MTAVLAFARAFWKPLLGVAVAVGIWWSVHHFGTQRFTAGYQQAVSENAKAIDDWQRKYDAIVARDEARLQYARTAHELELAQLAIAATKPLPAVVCRPASRSGGSVSAPTVISGGSDPPGGLVPSDAGVRPDIGPALGLLIQRADKLAADARELNSAVHP